MYKAVLFDLDGTLIHTPKGYSYRTVGKTLDCLGVGGYGTEDIDKFWFGADRDKTILQQFKVSPDLFWPEFRKHDTPEERKKSLVVYDDVRYIKTLKEMKFKIGIVTGAPDRIVPIEMEMVGENNFDVVVRAQLSSGIRPKPDPHGIEECLKILEVDKTKAVYVGNSDEDVCCARGAGVLDVLIDRGECKFDGLKPSLVIHSLYELGPILGV